MTAPYDRDPWEMTAIALDGSAYIELYEPPDVRAASKKRQSAWAMQSYWGVAYESYATTPGPANADADAASGDVPVPESREGREKWPEGWSGDVNTNIQVHPALHTASGYGRIQRCGYSVFEYARC